MAADGGGPGGAGGVAAARLTPEQIEAVLAEHEDLVRWAAWRAAGGSGAEAVEEAASLIRARFFEAALTYDPARGAKFSTYALRFALFRAARDVSKNRACGLTGGVGRPPAGCVPAPPPRVVRFAEAAPDGESGFDPADYRSAERDPLLRAWCSEDYAAQRRCLDWRSRVLLYLRVVESWTLDEVGAALEITRERVRQLELKAVAKIAAFRVRRQIAGLAS